MSTNIPVTESSHVVDITNSIVTGDSAGPHLPWPEGFGAEGSCAGGHWAGGPAAAEDDDSCCAGRFLGDPDSSSSSRSSSSGFSSCPEVKQ